MAKARRLTSKKNYFYNKSLIWATIFVFALTNVHRSVLAEDEGGAPAMSTSEAPASSSAPSLPELPAQEPNSTTEQPSTQPSLPEETTSSEESSQPSLPVEEASSQVNSGEQTTTSESESPAPSMPTTPETGTTTTRPSTVTILENQLSIRGTTVDALFTKDSNNELREIEIQDEAVINSDMGVTIIIPDETKIFAPSLVQPLVLENSFELPLEEELDQIIEDIQSGVTLITTIEQDTPLINSWENELLSGDEQIITGERSDEISGEEQIVTDEDFAGKPALISDEIMLAQLDTPVEESEVEVTWSKIFAFGLSGQHVVFTKPVEIHVAFPDAEENSWVLLRVKHEGEGEFGTRGLSADPTATCDEWGNISANAGIAFVQSGEVIFYTCGASEFSVGLVHDTFNPNMNGIVKSLVRQSDGDIVLGGAFTSGGVIGRNRIAMVTSTGILDTVFNTNFNGVVNVVALDTGDNVLIGGAFTTGGANLLRNRVARATSTGLLDALFTGNMNGTVNAIGVQSTGQIIVAGAFTTGRGNVTRNRLARLTLTGAIEPTFTGNANAAINSMLILPDDKILIGGAFTTVNGVTRNALARVTATGQIDPAFTGNVNGNVAAIAVQPDGKILIAWAFTTVHGVGRTRIARLTSTGLLDTTFSGDVNSQISGLQLLPDGRVVIAGNFTLVSGVPQSQLAVLTSSGIIDPTFRPSIVGAVHTVISDALSQSIYVGGALTRIDGITRNRFARIGLIAAAACGEPMGALSMGTLDATFNPDVNGGVYSMAFYGTTSNCLILGGGFTTVGWTARNRLARVTATGALDTTFNPNMNGDVNAMVIDTGNNLIIGGGFTTGGANVSALRLARITLTGSIDTTFTGNVNGVVKALALQPDGKVLLGGGFTTVNGVTFNHFARVSGTGQVDTTFTGNMNGNVNALAVQSDGKILVGGEFDKAYNVTVGYITRVSATGLRDTWFTGNLNSGVNVLVLQPDGQIIIGGEFTSVQGTTRNHIARLSNTGLLDASFNPDIDGSVSGLQLLGDGRILVGGSFTTVWGTPRENLVILEADGTIETQFTTTGNDTVQSFAVDGLNSFYLAGWFTSINNTTRNRAARIGLTDYTICGTTLTTGNIWNLDLSFDASFNGVVNSIWLQSNGCLIIGGAFTTGGTTNTTRNRIARTTMTGLLDMTFNPDLNGVVNALAIDTDDSIIAAGAFTTGGANLTRNRVARITSTGLVDNWFLGNANNTVNVVAIQPDGNILVGGLFTLIDNIAFIRIARLKQNGTLDYTFTGSANGAVNSIVLQPDNSILIAGAFTTGFANTVMTGVARLTSTGMIDRTFTGNIQFAATAPVNAIALQPDGNIIIAGAFTGVNGTTRNRIARITSTGELDLAFNPDINGTVSGLKLLSDGRIAVVGLFTLVGGLPQSNVALLNSDGTLDTSFQPYTDAGVSTVISDQSEKSLYIGWSFLASEGFQRRRVSRLFLTPPSICWSPSSLVIGWLDSNFAPEVDGMINTLWVQSAWCVVLGGGFTTVGWTARNRLARVTAAGVVDPNFDPNMNGTVNSLVVDTDDNIIIGGTFTTGAANISRQRIARITSTGLIDPTFTGLMNNTVNALALQPDGLIIAWGLFTSVNGVSNKRVARITTTGIADTSFVADVNGGPVNALGLQPDGNIVIGGMFTTVAGMWDSYVSRITSTGLRDSSFSGIVDNAVNAIAIQPDGNIVIGGMFTSVRGVARNYVARITSSGLLDPSFNPNVNAPVTGIQLLADGRILIGGGFTTVWGETSDHIALLASDGSLDTSFAATGDNTISSFALNGTGSVYVGGDFTSINNTTRNRLANIGLLSSTTCVSSSPSLAISTLDTDFNPNFSASIFSTKIRNDGCIFFWGSFQTVNGATSRRYAALLTSTGLADAVFNPNMNAQINSSALLPDGGVIVGGSFTTGGANLFVNRVARITSTGQIDVTFTGNANNTVQKVILQSDGKILIGGSFTAVGGITRNRLARLKSNGSLDVSFTGLLWGSVVNAIVGQSDGNIVVGGQFTGVQATVRNRIARLSSTGMVDPDFTGNINNTVDAIVQQPDGKFLVGWLFTGVNGTAKNRIVRLTSTGIVDPTFVADVTGTAAAAEVFEIELLPDGRILIGGTFTLVNGIPRNNVALLLPDGTLATSYDTSLSTTVNVIKYDVHTLSIYLGGSFTAIDGVTRNRAARVGMAPSLCVGLSGCVLWLKADAGLVLSGNVGVSGWRSQALQYLTGIQSTGARQPTYVTGVFNNNPAVRFDGVNQGLVVENKFLDNDVTQFVIFRSLDSSGSITTTSSTTGFAGTACGRGFNLSGGKVSVVLSWVRLSSTVTASDNTSQLVSWKYGTGIQQAISFKWKTDVTNNTWRPSVTWDNGMLIGRAAFGCLSGGAFSGDIAEIVTFYRDLSSLEEQYVESYLALKYGITLDQTVATDYLLQWGLEAWDSFVAGVYNNDIAGIGRNNNSSLNQLKSQAANDTGDISIEFTGTFNDDEFLVRGNDRGIDTWWNTTDIPADYYRMDREWFFEENYGDPGQVIVRFASGAIPAGIEDELIMFVDSDGAFGAGAVPYTGTLNGDYWEFPVNIADTEYITFGYYGPPPAGTVSIQSPTSLPYTGLLIPSYNAQTIAQHFNSGAEMYFAVDDGIGANPGYYTTLQLSGDLTTGAYSIAAANVSYKVSSTGVDLLAGTSNPRVAVDNAAIAYQNLASPRMFILRDSAPNFGVVGTYGSFIWLQIAVPANQAPGAYQGTLVYTIIEN